MTADEQITIQGLAALIREFLTTTPALIRDSLDQHRTIVTELKEQVDLLSNMVYDAEARQTLLHERVIVLQAQVKALGERVGNDTDRCTACVLQPRAGGAVAGE